MEVKPRDQVIDPKRSREGALASSGKDLLQSIIEGASSIHARPGAIDEFIVDNCKKIYFAGHETTAVAATLVLNASCFTSRMASSCPIRSVGGLSGKITRY